MQLHLLESSSTQKRKRVGRGPGSGFGKTSGRGHKGSKARSGYRRKRAFEGGQTPLNRRLPKFGFKNPNRQNYQLINLDRLEKLDSLKDGAVLDSIQMLQMGLISKNRLPIKLLGHGSLSKKIQITVNKASQSAMEAVKKAGGKIIISSQETS